MRALISVSDKTGVVEFAKGLRTLGWEVIATGGTMKLLADSGVEVINISDVTGFPEIKNGDGSWFPVQRVVNLGINMTF